MMKCSNRQENFCKELEKPKEFQKKYHPDGVPDNREILATLSKYTSGWIDFWKFWNRLTKFIQKSSIRSTASISSVFHRRMKQKTASGERLRFP